MTPKWKQKVANHAANRPYSISSALAPDTVTSEFPTFQRVEQGCYVARTKNDTNGYSFSSVVITPGCGPVRVVGGSPDPPARLTEGLPFPVILFVFS